MDIKFKYHDLLSAVLSEAPFKADIAIILGSGLGDFAESVNTVKSISTTELPGYPQSTVQGHKGYIHFSEYAGKKLLLFQGRIHFYEGYKLYECILPVLIANEVGVKKLILTNAAGGINSNFAAGDLMLIESFNTIQLKKELTDLIGLASPQQKNNVSGFPSEDLKTAIVNAALEEKVTLKSGVYYFTKGPSYETPAEIKMMSKTGNDAVGMSTSHEALYALSLGMKVAGISCITNLAAGISSVKLSHKEVMETANIVKGKFERLIKKTIELIQL